MPVGRGGRRENVQCASRQRRGLVLTTWTFAKPSTSIADAMLFVFLNTVLDKLQSDGRNLYIVSGVLAT